MTAQQVLDTRIIDLLKVPAEQRELDWLETSLQSAIELELSTIPPYLCAWWSIKDSKTDAATLIRSIIIEEMLHMGLACNMLTTITGTPNITIPVYPGHLPGGVRQELTVYLAGLSQDYLTDICMQIEYPESGPIALYRGITYPTIGAFYDAIHAAFHFFKPTLTGHNQLTTTFGSINQSLWAIRSLDDVDNAISIIKRQGEGTSESPDAGGFGGTEELAHYYKFAEIYHGHQLIQQNGRWVYEGPAIPFPDTYQMAQVPAGGWPNPPQNVQQLLKQFNTTFQSMLTNLENAWKDGNEDELGTAISLMFDLGDPAIDLMKIALPSGSGNYGPDFRLPTS
ncbi:ferritin-like domain-containing protein [Nostoc sp.]|uniref:ferritin-like domain-containing protein n=1 Tax=Nostoc sp. TaxID=1180 RepID=UPI002FFA07DB